MPYRTTEAAVKKIVEVDDEIDLEPFIETANFVVTDNCTNSNYSDAKLELIERWLSAHFYAIRDPRSIENSVKGLTERFDSNSGQKFSATRYGQQALILDNAGNLKSLDQAKSAKISIKHLGGSVYDRDYPCGY